MNKDEKQNHDSGTGVPDHEEPAESVGNPVDGKAEAAQVEVVSDTPQAKEKHDKKDKNPHSRRVLRRGMFTTAFIVIVIVVVVIVNIIGSALATRYPLQLDLTPDKQLTLSAQNITYLQGLQKDVTITVCSTKANFANDLTSALSSVGIQDTTGGQYIQQAAGLLDSYTKYTSHITLQYIDPDTPALAALKSKFSSNNNFQEGDVVVWGAATTGTEMPHTVIQATSMFSTAEDQQAEQYYGTAAYDITGCTLESALTSAIDTVATGKTFTIAVLGGHGTQSVNTSSSGNAAASFEGLMEQYGYSFTTVDNLLNEDIPSDANVLLIAAPQTDYTADELAKISTFLTNGGNYGKALYYIANSANQAQLTNMNAFLAEWGFTMGSGNVYETDTTNYTSGNNLALLLSSAGSTYTSSLDAQNPLYYSTDNAPITFAWTAQGNYTTSSILTTSSTCVTQPLSVPSNWAAVPSEETTYQALGLSQYTTYQNTTKITSSVLVASSMDMISYDLLQNSGVVNIAASLYAINDISGKNSSSINFDTKFLTTTDFSAKVTQTASTTWEIIFEIAIPLCMIAAGIWVYVRRRSL